MSIQNLPRAAQLYIGTVILIGGLCLALAFRLWPIAMSDWLVVVPGLLIAVGAGVLTIPIIGFSTSGRAIQNSALSLGMVPVFLLLIAFGPFAGALTAAVTSLVSTLYPTRSYLVQTLFSMAASVVAVLLASPVLLWAGLAHPGTSFPAYVEPSGMVQIQQAVATLVAGAIYFLINSVLVVLAISLTGRIAEPSKIVQTWRDNYLWVFPAYVAAAAAAALLYALLPNALIHWQSSLALLTLAFPVPILIYYAAQYHRERDVNYRNYIEELERGREELRGLYTATVESFALAIDAKDRYTQEHIQRVKSYAVKLATEMNVSESDYKAVEYGALLHDIGKIAIPENILCKPGKLTPQEFETMKTHTVIGAKILEPVRFPFPVREVVRSHHERWDGSGYPDALRGEQIPIGARILAVSDVYDALTTDRSYRRAWSRTETMTYLQRNMGSHFDPHVVSAFLRILRREEERTEAMVDGAVAAINDPPVSVR